MIFKSYIIENNDEVFSQRFFLFYGENLGLKKYFKQKVRKNFKKCEILNYSQDEIIKMKKNFESEFSNLSLFEKNKIFLINDANDKLLEIIERLTLISSNNRVYIFSDVLDKKSKLRNYFEKSKEHGITACYPDNETTIRRIITNELRGFEGLNAININIICDNCNNDRDKLLNEIEKIKTYFFKKKIETQKLEDLLNLKSVDDFNSLKDQVLIGNKKLINKLLSETYLDNEKHIYYISLINQRLKKLLELRKKMDETKVNATTAIEQLRPPVFWKDKQNFLIQSNKLDSNKINQIFKKTYNLEVKMKNNSIVNKTIIFKKLLLDIFELSNAS